MNGLISNLLGLLLLVFSVSAEARTCLNVQSKIQVIILPPTGGANPADSSLFSALCQRGYEVTLLNYAQKSGLTTDLKIHDQLSRDVLGEINIFLKQNPKPTILIGASLGGLYASMAYGYSLTNQTEFDSLSWVKGIVLTVAGGPLNEILSESTLPQVILQRNLRRFYGAFSSLDQYRTELKNEIFYDPMTWARPEARHQVLMFNSKLDTVVPSSSQEALWQAWGQPKVERLWTNHLLSITSVYFFKVNRIDEFLSQF